MKRLRCEELLGEPTFPELFAHYEAATPNDMDLQMFWSYLVARPHLFSFFQHERVLQRQRNEEQFDMHWEPNPQYMRWDEERGRMMPYLFDGTKCYKPGKDEVDDGDGAYFTVPHPRETKTWSMPKYWVGRNLIGVPCYPKLQ